MIVIDVANFKYMFLSKKNFFFLRLLSMYMFKIDVRYAITKIVFG